MRDKYKGLLLAIVFVSQTSTSLHSFDLDPPVKLQFFFIDILIFLVFFGAVELKQRFAVDRVGAIWLGLLFWMGVTTFSSAHVDKSVVFLYWNIKYFVIYTIVRNANLDESFVKRLLWVSAMVIFLQGALSFAQYVKGGHLGLVVLGERDSERDRLYYVQGVLRVSGTLGVSNGFAAYIGMYLVLLAPFVVMPGVSIIIRSAYFFGVAPLIMPFSRAAWLAFLISTAIVGLKLTIARYVAVTRIFFIGIAACLVLAGILSLFMERIQNRFEDKEAMMSAMGRVTQFDEAANNISLYPVFGIGPGVSEFFGDWNDHQKFVKDKLPKVRMGNQYHNNLLQIVVETGIFGGVLFAMFFVAVLYSALTVKTSGIESSMVGAARISAGCAALVFLIHSSFGTELNNRQMFIFFAFLLGLSRNCNWDRQCLSKK